MLFDAGFDIARFLCLARLDVGFVYFNKERGFLGALGSNIKEYS